MYHKKITATLTCVLDLIGEVLYGKRKMRLLLLIDEGHQLPSELRRKIPDASRRFLPIQLKNWKSMSWSPLP